jgi:hypothetical protein
MRKEKPITKRKYPKSTTGSLLFSHDALVVNDDVKCRVKGKPSQRQTDMNQTLQCPPPTAPDASDRKREE